MRDSTIIALRREAAEAGDWEMVDICDRALDGEDEALVECERVLEGARAMND